MKGILCRLFIVVCCAIGFLGMNSGSCQAAPSHKVESFHYKSYKDGDRDWLKIEIGLSRDNLEYEVSDNPDKPNQLLVLMKNTKPGEIKKNIGLDRKIARYMTVREKNKNDLQIMIATDGDLATHEYKVYTVEKDKKTRKPYRLVIEIAGDEGKPVDTKPVPDIPEDELMDSVAGHTIVLDPGHGGTDNGASGPSLLREKDVTLSISLEAARILRENGARVLMTRFTDVDVFGPVATDKQELQARVDVARRDPSVEMFVSVHCNAFTNSEANGTGTYFYPHSSRDAMLAQYIQNEMVHSTGLRDRGITSARFYVLRNSRVPATLVETAFITNPYEESMLANVRCQYTMAKAICRGINNYFRDTLR